MFPEHEIITGDRIQELADVSIATSQKLQFHSGLSELGRKRACLFEPSTDGRIYMSSTDLKRLQMARTIFVYGDFLEVFFVVLAPHLNQPFVLISHNSDISVDQRFEHQLGNPLLLRWYAQNIDPSWQHPKLISIPIGVANRQWPHGNLANISSQNPYSDKSIWLYVNINVTTNPSYRNEIVAALSENSVSVVEQGLAVQQYCRRIGQSCFVASPRGNGIDCHRTWEALYLGAVPVMPHQDRVACLEGLPVLETEDWRDLSPDRLKAAWESLTSTDWQLKRLYMSYWQERIEDEFTLSITAGRRQLPIIMIYLGPELPAYINVALRQTRLFSSDNIYMVINASTRNQLDSSSLEGIRVVTMEELGYSPSHSRFKETSLLDTSFRNGFWTYTTERFYVLETVMRTFGINSVVHIECDNLIYFDPSDYELVFRNNYSGIAAPFDNDQRCIPGFVYIRSLQALEKMTSFMLEALNNPHCGPTNDMKLVADYRLHDPSCVATLPVITPDYLASLCSLTGLKAADPSLYWNNFDLFRSLFDAAALGQYLGGIDPSITAEDTHGFINESAVYDPRHFIYETGVDAKGRKCYFARTPTGLWRINTLHIHSKNLTDFAS